MNKQNSDEELHFHKESEGSLPFHISTSCGSKVEVSVIDLQVVLKTNPMQNAMEVRNNYKIYLKQKIRVFVLPRSKDSILVSLKLYNISTPIKLKGSSLIHDFKEVNQIKENLEQISPSSWIGEISFEMKFVPYDKQDPYSNLKNECLLSFTYEDSRMTSTFSLLVVRIINSPETVFTHLSEVTENITHI